MVLALQILRYTIQVIKVTIYSYSTVITQQFHFRTTVVQQQSLVYLSIEHVVVTVITDCTDSRTNGDILLTYTVT